MPQGRGSPWDGACQACTHSLLHGAPICPARLPVRGLMTAMTQRGALQALAPAPAIPSQCRQVELQDAKGRPACVGGWQCRQHEGRTWCWHQRCPGTPAAPNQACSARTEQLVLGPSAGGYFTRSVPFGQPILSHSEICQSPTLNAWHYICLMLQHLDSVPSVILERWVFTGGGHALWMC